ncbi:MAG TPA: hypothetical protein VGM88_19250 [Kofleriaceae bacterium]|jgi:hypothetical protein
MTKWIAVALLVGACGTKEPSEQCKAARKTLADGLRQASHRVTVAHATLGQVKAFPLREHARPIDKVLTDFSQVQADDAAAMTAAEAKRAAEAPQRAKDLTFAADALEHADDLDHAKSVVAALDASDHAAYDKEKADAQSYLARVDALTKQTTDALATATPDDAELLKSQLESLSTAHDLYALRAKLTYFDRELLPMLLTSATDMCK